MLPRSLLVCVIDLLLIREASGWSHVDRDQFESITTKNELSLVAFVARIKQVPGIRMALSNSSKSEFTHQYRLYRGRGPVQRTRNNILSSDTAISKQWAKAEISRATESFFV
ncbi:hypothetical protein ONS96_003010 [Cadophora gregata f. sp. sojae]|nr:hypothetical protein ONS96_003010 [Cadophora gregata f. sp. sojae]